MTLIAMSAAGSAAAAAWATFAILVLTALFAWRQLREAARLRREQTRPFVVIQYEFRDVLIQLAIRNLGKTVARNVKTSFDRPLQSRQFGDERFAEMALFRDGIPNLAPGQEIRVHFDHFPNRVDGGLPMRYVASIKYDDHEGRALPADEFVLDLSPYKQAARGPKGLHELVEAVERVRGEMAKWTDGSHGLLVNAVDRARTHRAEERSYRLGQALRVRRDKGWLSALLHLANDWQRRGGWYAE
jgi:hypothetical protein